MIAGGLNAPLKSVHVWPTDISSQISKHEALVTEYMLHVHRISSNYFALVLRMPVEVEGGRASVEPRSETEHGGDMLDDNEFTRANELCKKLFNRTLTREEVIDSLPLVVPQSPLSTQLCSLSPHDVPVHCASGR